MGGNDCANCGHERHAHLSDVSSCAMGDGNSVDGFCSCLEFIPPALAVTLPHLAAAKCGEGFSSTTSLAFAVAARDNHEAACPKCKAAMLPGSTCPTCGITSKTISDRDDRRVQVDYDELVKRAGPLPTTGMIAPVTLPGEVGEASRFQLPDGWIKRKGPREYAEEWSGDEGETEQLAASIAERDAETYAAGIAAGREQERTACEELARPFSHFIAQRIADAIAARSSKESK